MPANIRCKLLVLGTKPQYNYLELDRLRLDTKYNLSRIGILDRLGPR